MIEYERRITLERAEVRRVRLWLRLFNEPRPIILFEPSKITKFISFYDCKIECKQFMRHKFNVGGSKK